VLGPALARGSRRRLALALLVSQLGATAMLSAVGGTSTPSTTSAPQLGADAPRVAENLAAGHPDSLDRAAHRRAVRWYAAIARTRREHDARVFELVVAAQRREGMWDELAECESGGNWTVVDRYGDGLGIYIGTWEAFGGSEYADNPGYATKAEQIAVAERIYARFGLTGWGCARNMGWTR
jgi:hypothetical protein